MAPTIRFYYDATIAVALTSVFALAVALIAAVIVGGTCLIFPSRPSFLRSLVQSCFFAGDAAG